MMLIHTHELQLVLAQHPSHTCLAKPLLCWQKQMLQQKPKITNQFLFLQPHYQIHIPYEYVSS